MSKRFLSLHRHLPGLQARESLDVVLVAGVFDQQVSLLFREEGVRQLAESEISVDMAEAVRSLSDYGIDAVYVCADALVGAELTPDRLLIPVKVLTPAEQSELLRDQDMVLCD